MSEEGLKVERGLLARNTAFNIAGQLLPVGVAVFAMPAVIDGLGTNRFGLLGIVWLMLYYFGELGFARATVRFVADALGRGDGQGVSVFAWTTIVFQAALGLVLGIALAGAAAPLAGGILEIPGGMAEEARRTLLVLALTLPALLAGAAFRGVLEAGQRFGIINAVRIPVSAGNFLLPLVGLWLGWGMPGIVALLLGSRVLMLAIFAAAALILYPSLRRIARPRREQMREVLGYGGWVTVSGVVSPVLVHLDRFMLGVLATIGAVGYYTAPYELVTRMWIIPMSLVATLFPALSSLAANGNEERVRRLTARAVKYVALSLGPVVVFILGAGHDLLDLWLGSDFARESTLALQILAVGVLVNSAASVPYTLLQGIGRPDIPAKFHLLELPIHVVTVVVLIQAWGIPGAALAWTIRVTLDAVLLFAATTRVAGVSTRVLFRERAPHTGLAVLVFGAAAVAGASLLGGLWERGLFSLALLTLMAPVLWKYLLAESDRIQVRELLALRSGR